MKLSGQLCKKNQYYRRKAKREGRKLKIPLDQVNIDGLKDKKGKLWVGIGRSEESPNFVQIDLFKIPYRVWSKYTSRTGSKNELRLRIHQKWHKFKNWAEKYRVQSYAL